jgi:uncharacterized tellurite resistance protein B-like protein
LPAEVPLTVRPGGEWDPVAHWRGLVDLAMAVARADDELDPREVASIRAMLEDEFSLPREHVANLRRVMRRSRCGMSDLPYLIEGIRFRMPQVRDSGLLSLMRTVAEADGVVRDSEVAMIEEAERVLKAMPKRPGASVQTSNS